jgi:putative ABC transport system permease protein
VNNPGSATVISLAGGVIGIAVGFAGSRMLNVAAGWNTAISLGGIGLAFAFAAGAGMFFGIYPARKASKFDPIAALHSE